MIEGAVGLDFGLRDIGGIGFALGNGVLSEKRAGGESNPAGEGAQREAKSRFHKRGIGRVMEAVGCGREWNTVEEPTLRGVRN